MYELLNLKTVDSPGHHKGAQSTNTPSKRTHVDKNKSIIRLRVQCFVLYGILVVFYGILLGWSVSHPIAHGFASFTVSIATAERFRLSTVVSVVLQLASMVRHVFLLKRFPIHTGPLGIHHSHGLPNAAPRATAGV